MYIVYPRSIGQTALLFILLPKQGVVTDPSKGNDP